MIYNDYRIHLLTCEYLGKEPTGEYKKLYDFFTVMWDGMELAVDSRYNRILLQKDMKWFFGQYSKNGYLWCQYDRVWSFFRTDMGMEITETKDFIKSTVEEHLKCVVGTPSMGVDMFLDSVEEHLKCVVGTPCFCPMGMMLRVEEHLKCDVGTPWDVRSDY